MNLNVDNKNKIRKLIKKITKEIPDGERLKIDEKVLDDLIFFKRSDGIKIPVWTGSFLKKLDMSKISFENTILSYKPFDDYHLLTYDDYHPLTYRDFFSKEELENFEQEYEKCNGKSFISVYNNAMWPRNEISQYIFDFSDTNINIDFSSLGYKKAISGCNFSGVDLSRSNINIVKIIRKCNLSNSGIDIDFKDKIINQCNLSHNNLSDKEFEMNIGNLETINDNDLSKTGINIKMNQNYISIGGTSLYIKKTWLRKYINETIRLIQLGIINNKGLMQNVMTLNDKIEYLKTLGIIRDCALVSEKNSIYSITYDNEILLELLNNMLLGNLEECSINEKQLKKNFKK